MDLQILKELVTEATEKRDELHAKGGHNIERNAPFSLLDEAEGYEAAEAFGIIGDGSDFIGSPADDENFTNVTNAFTFGYLMAKRSCE